MTPGAINNAIEEARRRQAVSDRDVSAEVEHFAAVLRPVCDDWGLTAECWLEGGAGMPVLAVSSTDGRPGVLKICRPGAADGAVRVIQAAAGVGYVRTLAWDPRRGALLTERLGADLWATTTELAEQTKVVVPCSATPGGCPWTREPRSSARHPGSGAQLLRGTCGWLGELADVAPERVWRWGFVERVTTGLYLRWFGYPHESATFLDSATTLARPR